MVVDFSSSIIPSIFTGLLSTVGKNYPPLSGQQLRAVGWERLGGEEKGLARPLDPPLGFSLKRVQEINWL